ncbi:hypothetical protein ACFSTD_14090 [Novosphingobium colocasiae]
MALISAHRSSTGWGVLLGLVLLIVPGLFLMSCWSMAGCLVLTRNLRAREALGASWEATRKCGWMLVLVYTLAILAVVLAVVALGAVGGVLFGTESIAQTVITECVGDLVTTVSAVLSVAIYRQLIGSMGPLRTIFA